MYTTSSTTYSCPVIYVFWGGLPLYPPTHNLEALKFPADKELTLDFIKDYLCSFINLYYSTLHPFTTPLEYEE